MKTIDILNEGFKERYLKDSDNTSKSSMLKEDLAAYIQHYKYFNKKASSSKLTESTENTKQLEIDLEDRLIEYFKKNRFDDYDELYAYKLPNGNFNLSFDIYWGDWKHEHLRADYLVKQFISENADLTLVDIWDEPGPDTGEDVYDAKHVYIISQKLAESLLKESLTYRNGIDRRLILGAQDIEDIPNNLVTNNMIDSARSAMYNVKYLLSKGKKCQLCVGTLMSEDGRSSGNIVSHVWVKDDKGNIYQTFVPSKAKSVKKFKSITLTPEDLDRLEKKITKFVKY